MQFDQKTRLGSGHFGEVWLATDLGLNVDRALKLIPPDRVPDKTNFSREAQLLKEAEHPNIVRVESTGVMPDGRIFVAMEYLPKGSVDDESKGAYLPLTRAKKIMIDVLRGLEWAHGKGILHHDIKPGNILIGNANEGKLSDFGLAIRPGKDAASLGVKNYNYLLHIAPETYKSRDYGIASDIYAAGVTLYRMVNGDSTLPSISPQEAARLALRGEYPDREKYRAFIPRPMRLLINKAMSVEPKSRFSSAEEMRRALEQVVVRMNWSQKTGADFVRWAAGWDKKCYEVVLMQPKPSHYDVIVKKGPSKHELRKMARLCAYGLPKDKAQKFATKVLQDFVMGKIN
jgi:serine/threonine protein kinase